MRISRTLPNHIRRLDIAYSHGKTRPMMCIAMRLKFVLKFVSTNSLAKLEDEHGCT